MHLRFLPYVASVDLTHFTRLRELDLADDPQSYDGTTGNIDILIGSDHYWGIIIGDVTRKDDSPVAVSS